MVMFSFYLLEAIDIAVASKKVRVKEGRMKVEEIWAIYSHRWWYLSVLCVFSFTLFTLFLLSSPWISN
jgi:hypothetical protein